MRKIEQRMIEAIKAGKPFLCGNTRVRQLVGGGFRVELHGNGIAWAAGKTPKGGFHGVLLDHCGWKTATTKSRMNAVLAAVGSGSRVYQRKGEWLVMQAAGPHTACDRAAYSYYFVR